MKLKLIAIAAVFSSFCLSSCDKKDDLQENADRSRYTYNYDFFMTGAQVVPASNSTASGRIEGVYDQRTKIYTYTITWAGLSSSITSMHIHGVADRGFAAMTTPGVALYPGGIVQNITGFKNVTSGTFSGTLNVDGTAVREADLLNSKFYVDIHTTNYPNGEIRAQIIFF